MKQRGAEEVENAGDAEFGGELLDPHRNSFFSASSLLIAARLRYHNAICFSFLPFSVFSLNATSAGRGLISSLG
jgi:hypothetical protein